MPNQSDTQASLRTSTGKAYDYNGDWSAQFDLDGIAAGDWNGRCLAWINQTLGITYSDITGAQTAYAVNQGFNDWSAMGTITLAPSNAYVAENGTTYYVAENGTTYYTKET